MWRLGQFIIVKIGLVVLEDWENHFNFCIVFYQGQFFIKGLIKNRWLGSNSKGSFSYVLPSKLEALMQFREDFDFGSIKKSRMGASELMLYLQG